MEASGSSMPARAALPSKRASGPPPRPASRGPRGARGRRPPPSRQPRRRPPREARGRRPQPR
eukprot:15485114-Alexandrium_andersonii.AAC.1